MSPGVNIDFCTFRFGDFCVSCFDFLDFDSAIFSKFLDFLRVESSLLPFSSSQFQGTSDLANFLKRFIDFQCSEISRTRDFLMFFDCSRNLRGVIVFGSATTLLDLQNLNGTSDHSSSTTYPNFSNFNGASDHSSLRFLLLSPRIFRGSQFSRNQHLPIFDPMLRNSVLVAQLGKGTRRKFWVPPPRSRNRSFCFGNLVGVEVMSRVLRFLLPILKNFDLLYLRLFLNIHEVSILSLNIREVSMLSLNIHQVSGLFSISHRSFLGSIVGSRLKHLSYLGFSWVLNSRDVQRFSGLFSISHRYFLGCIVGSSLKHFCILGFLGMFRDFQYFHSIFTIFQCFPSIFVKFQGSIQSQARST
jgi:hypothetical protein